MQAALVTFAIFLLLYPFGLFVWSQHMARRYDNEIHAPWGMALAFHDTESAAMYEAAAMTFLEDYTPNLRHFHPLHWIETWNKQYVPSVKVKNNG